MSLIESEAMVVPDEVEVTIGWRRWCIDSYEGPLRSMINETLWQPKIAMRALHVEPYRSLFLNALNEEHMATTAGHDIRRCDTCGIYARRSLRSLHDFYKQSPPAPGQVFGTVRLWGTVVEGEIGYRASHAYPDHLYMMEHPLWAREPEWHRKGRARYLGDVYGVPCELVTLDEYLLMVNASPHDPPRETDDSSMQALTVQAFGIKVSNTEATIELSQPVRSSRNAVLKGAIAANLGACALNLSLVLYGFIR